MLAAEQIPVLELADEATTLEEAYLALTAHQGDFVSGTSNTDTTSVDEERAQ